MEKLAVGSIILVNFPFSNLKGKKVRPALVVAHGEFDNVVLCQITSRPYTSKTAIRIGAHNFEEGKLPVVSFVRPDKLFTADASIIKDTAGKLKLSVTKSILQKIRKQFKVS